MEPLTPLVIGAALGCVGYWLWQRLPQRPARRPARHAPSATQRRRQEQLNRVNRKARALQLALFHLDQAPDFRRAASWAAQAQDLPAAFRQRQFRRFRATIVRYFASRLASGGDPTALTESLATLLRHLGIATFEAEYIRAEAERRMPASMPVRAGFPERLAALQRDHQERLTALRQLQHLEEGARERLLEAEEARFQQALLEAGGEPQP